MCIAAQQVVVTRGQGENDRDDQDEASPFDEEGTPDEGETKTPKRPSLRERAERLSDAAMTAVAAALATAQAKAKATEAEFGARKRRLTVGAAGAAQATRRRSSAFALKVKGKLQRVGGCFGGPAPHAAPADVACV